LFPRWLAAPLAKHVKPMLPHVGIHDPTVIWLLSPVIVFLILLIPFKSAGFFCASQGERSFQVQGRHPATELVNRLNAARPLFALVTASPISCCSRSSFSFQLWTGARRHVRTTKADSTIADRMGRGFGNHRLRRGLRAPIEPDAGDLFQGRRFCRAAGKSAVARPAGGLSDAIRGRNAMTSSNSDRTPNSNAWKTRGIRSFDHAPHFHPSGKTRNRQSGLGHPSRKILMIWSLICKPARRPKYSSEHYRPLDFNAGRATPSCAVGPVFLRVKCGPCARC